MKKLKIFFGILCFACLFGLWTTPVSAASIVYDTPPLPTAYKDIADDYPYYAFIALDSSYVFCCSNKPITFDGNETVKLYGDSYVYSKGSLTSYSDGGKIRFKADQIKDGLNYYTHTTEANGPYMFQGWAYHLFHSSHTLSDDNGNVTFRVPLLTPETVAPLITQTHQNQTIIIGGTICLVVLGVSLTVLCKQLPRFLGQ
ncbi:hypothetical protein [Longicatena caecimuris]|uniref:Uncharacterized protein n=1 Tax=Longicatena caecimuris TaxID=1796635 RepID=A0A4R3TNY8_9FIRM|nr:hypothetical protein [Longicatena caecimuris]MCR1868965.1 hypothetical protein [Longicatena caecimuris]MCR1868974.1 hypothetical protein [Longicatena caecimuris]MCU0101455.1 hypothetical protein [Longicatena caecimuris]MCU0101464.1 hypothetical protein [Longicatena caecimuris]TCU63498.1 hypothetical protein EDD61_101150 [Longicatena caecimuris]